jgi:hypothetical protein
MRGQKDDSRELANLLRFSRPERRIELLSVLSTEARNDEQDPGQKTIISRRQSDDISCVDRRTRPRRRGDLSVRHGWDRVVRPAAALAIDSLIAGCRQVRDDPAT